jgi:hypothetical protein
MLRTPGMKLGHLALLSFLALPLASTGCYVEADTPTVAYGYEPQYYDGRMVYYDDYGHPFYYEGGAQVWVPTTSPYYWGYVNHWRAYGPAYRRWYGAYGYRYRGWTGYRGYYGGHAGYHAYRRR